ncbi:amidohydrolase [Salinigranum rubrum]|uniref:Amidohydrolase n=1 Tax=Salinigranum rubrum TaxID=755307 RepID=A0A2I8VM08_9EURY|nr:amidohydrolase [Salinigranum rubrum]AUV82948.1 amidohydrolase [Salinigranum rubrum]
MTAAADLILTDAEVHSLSDPDETYEALAVRDGRIVRLTNAYDVDFLAGTDTRVVELDGRVVLPGFVDAHTHLPMVGRRLVHADLSVDSRTAALDHLRERAAEVEVEGEGERGNEWVQGFGYDESRWDDDRYLTRTDLDGVSDSRPVVAFREDMHVASLNSVALDRLGLAAGDHGGDVQGEEEATGVLVETAVDDVWDAVSPTRDETRALIEAAQRHANERGVTGVHDMVRNSHAPEVYRDLQETDDLSLRVRLNYWSDHLDALIDVGLRTNHGSGLVTVGAIKTYTDGSFGGRTAKLSSPYADADTTGQWVVPPAELNALVTRADDAGFQVTAHAIGDEAVEAVLDAFERVSDADADSRHRIEHVELADDAAIERMRELGVVASVQPNFLKWADEGGLYERRLGPRRTETNRYRAMVDAGVPLAFGSDCMPLDPLLGIACAVDAPHESQRLSTTEALRAYTAGGAYAGFDEDRLGTLALGTRADLVVLDESPWEADETADVDPVMTVVDGDVVYESESLA